MNILEGLIPGEDAPKQADASHLEKLFVFSLMWSVGALLELEDRKKVLLSKEVYYPVIQTVAENKNYERKDCYQRWKQVLVFVSYSDETLAVFWLYFRVIAVELKSKQVDSLYIKANKAYIWVIDQAWGQNGWVLTKFCFLHVNKLHARPIASNNEANIQPSFQRTRLVFDKPELEFCPRVTASNPEQAR